VAVDLADWVAIGNGRYNRVFHLSFKTNPLQISPSNTPKRALKGITSSHGIKQAAGLAGRHPFGVTELWQAIRTPERLI
jgi:hypothetical protein